MTENKYLDLFKCPFCDSINVENLDQNNTYCCSCDRIFEDFDVSVYNKIIDKKIKIDCDEMDIESILDNSLESLFKRGIVLMPEIEKEIRERISEDTEEESIVKLSFFEGMVENMEKNNQKGDL